MKQKSKTPVMAGFMAVLFFFLAGGIDTLASEKTGYDFLSSGIAEVLDPSALSNEAPVKEQREMNLNEKFEAEMERMERI